MNKKILIIGGTGYIGTRLNRELSLSYPVTTVDLEWFGKALATNNLVVNYSSLSEDFLSNFDIIILLAAYASVSLCDKVRELVVANDVKNFSFLVAKLRKIAAKKKIKFIYASTGSVYGNQDSLCIEEKEGCVLSTYDLCKRFNDDYMSLIHKDIEYYGLRFGTVNGWSDHLRIDIMINSMFHDARRKGVISCSAPNQCRGILDIEDLIRTVEQIIDSKWDKRGIYNLSSFNSSIGDIATTVGKILNCSVITGNATSPYSYQLDCSRIRKAFPELNLRGSIKSIIEQLEKEKPAMVSVRNI